MAVEDPYRRYMTTPAAESVTATTVDPAQREATALIEDDGSLLWLFMSAALTFWLFVMLIPLLGSILAATAVVAIFVTLAAGTLFTLSRL